MKKIKNKKLNILITCANRKIHIINWLRDSVKEIKIYVADSKKNPVSKYFADEFWHSPEFNNKNFLKIYKYLKDKKISFIFPTSDSELKFWSFYKNLLRKKNIFVMISDYETIELCSDKLKFYKFLKKNKITTIETSENLNTIKSKKFVVKERFSSGSKNCFLNLSKKKCKLLSKKIRKPIFQNFVDGKEVSIDCFIGKNIYVVLRYRELINGSESEKTTIFVNRKIKKIIINLLAKMNFTGHVMFQGFLNANKFYLNECNPRIGGASAVSAYSGVSSFLFFINDNLNIKNKIFIKKKSHKSFVIHKVITPID